MDRVCVYLNGARGIAVTKAIAAAGHKIQWIITPPNPSDELAGLARQIGAELLSPPDVNDDGFVSTYRGLKPRVAVIAGFSAILKKPVYAAPEFGTINLHAGALPQYRGGSPLNWQ